MRTTLIDDIHYVARKIGADQCQYSPSELHRAYLAEFPDANRGLSLGGFAAMLAWYCINMQSRFPDAKNPRKPAAWLTRPLFKRVARGQYMLLSDEEIARFRQCEKEDHPLIYTSEYDVDLLEPATKPDAKGGVPMPIGDSELTPALRALRGITLFRQGQRKESLEHLAFAWRQGEQRVDVARAYATLCREQEQYDLAASPYNALMRLAPETLDALDYKMIAQLVLLGQIKPINDVEQVEYVNLFCAGATPDQLHTDDAKELVYENLKFCRTLYDPAALFAAYQRVLDILLGWANAQEVIALLNEINLDYQWRRLGAEHYIDLLDESIHHYDADCLVADAIVGGYVDIFNREIKFSLIDNRPMPAYTNDVWRSLQGLAPVVCDELWKDHQRQREALQRKAVAVAPIPIVKDPPVALNGKLIALVGGHMRTRREVREEIEKCGGDVIEVPPSNEATFDGNAVLAKVKSSQLLVMIVGYMGHDLSTVIDNAKNRGAVNGTILRVPFRGKSGVFREIMRWASST